MKVLIIDDHPFFLEGLKIGIENLGDQNYIIDTITSTPKAINHLNVHRQYDLILCDLNMPEINGIQFIEQMVRRDIWVRIAIISASEDPRDITDALSAGAAAFINKAISPEGLRDVFNEIKAGNCYVPPSYLAYQQSKKGCVSHEGAEMVENAQKMGITLRQFDVLKLIAQGCTNKEICENLGVTESTVKSHVRALFQILDVSNRTACLLEASNLRLLP